MCFLTFLWGEGRRWDEGEFSSSLKIMSFLYGRWALDVLSANHLDVFLFFWKIWVISSKLLKCSERQKSCLVSISIDIFVLRRRAGLIRDSRSNYRQSLGNTNAWVNSDCSFHKTASRNDNTGIVLHFSLGELGEGAQLCEADGKLTGKPCWERLSWSHYHRLWLLASGEPAAWGEAKPVIPSSHQIFRGGELEHS